MEKINSNNFVNYLKEYNLKLTNQRYLVAKFLFDGKNKHFTAEDLYEKISLKTKNISLATVYNTLHSFVEKKLLKKVSVKDNKTIFCTNMVNHYHFYNPDTGELIDIKNGEINFEKLPKTPKGTKIDSIEVVIKLKKGN